MILGGIQWQPMQSMAVKLVVYIPDEKHYSFAALSVRRPNRTEAPNLSWHNRAHLSCPSQPTHCRPHRDSYEIFADNAGLARL